MRASGGGNVIGYNYFEDGYGSIGYNPIGSRWASTAPT